MSRMAYPAYFVHTACISRRSQLSIFTSRSMPSKNTNLQDWSSIYCNNSLVNDQLTPRKRSLRGANSSKPIGVKRSADNEEFCIGDGVLVQSSREDPFVGIIESVVETFDGDLEVRILWFNRPGDVKPEKRPQGALDNELYITLDRDRNPVDVILGKAKVGNAASDELFCRRACNSAKLTFSEEFNWHDIYTGRETNMEELIDKVEELLGGNKGSSRSPDKKKASLNKPKYKEESDDDKVDEENSEKENGKYHSDMTDDDQDPSPKPSKRKSRKILVKAPRTPKKRRTVSESGRITTTTPTKIVTPRTSNPNSPSKNRIFVKPPLFSTTLPIRTSSSKSQPSSPHKQARASLHVSSVPDYLPCRENEFSQIYLSLESAITSGTGSCVYVSGTPGTGKTATIKEVVSQLELRSSDKELAEFSFLEINGMKLTNPHTAYEMLWQEISGGQRVSATNAMVMLEQEFKSPNPRRVPTVVLMDELDQLVTKNQGVMYNFFNWPTFAHSRLIVVAVANTMDLPERMLSNKISSRLGLTRIQFPGYTYEQLKEIIATRLKDIAGDLIEKDAAEFASRKIAGVSGDARRALDICRRAVELTENEGKATKVNINHVKRAISESTNSPIHIYLQTLPVAGKIFLCAVLARVRRSGVVENSLADVLEETERLIKLSSHAELYTRILFGGNRVRMAGFLNAVNELVEGGILVQQMMRGERSANVRLSIGEEEIKSALRGDVDVEDML